MFATLHMVHLKKKKAECQNMKTISRGENNYILLKESRATRSCNYEYKIKKL